MDYRHRERRPDAELLDEEEMCEVEKAPIATQKSKAAAVKPQTPCALQAVGDRIARGKAIVVGLLYAPEQEDAIVGGEREGDDEQEYEV